MFLSWNINQLYTSYLVIYGFLFLSLQLQIQKQYKLIKPSSSVVLLESEDAQGKATSQQL